MGFCPRFLKSLAGKSLINGKEKMLGIVPYIIGLENNLENPKYALTAENGESLSEK